MRKNYPYLNNPQFLKQIINQTNVIYYCKISILNWQQEVIRDIQSKVLTASINVNGNSAVRRTANISFVLEQNDSDAAQILNLNKKIYLEIGYLNETDNFLNYPIIWFPLGLYVITNISFSYNLNNITASLELKDKMCLLNGELGGTFPAAVVFDNYQQQDADGNITIIKPTIYQIITELVNHFGGQQLGKIIISDVDLRIKRLMRWTGNTPLYVLHGGAQGEYYITVDQMDAISKINNGGYSNEPGSPFTIGSNIGFILEDFYYPDDLIGNAGDSVVSVLDKIKKTLGNYEYYYDLYGNFRFQEVKNYLNNAQSKYLLESIQNNQLVPDYLSQSGEAYLLRRTNGKAVFSFKENNNLVISYANTPKMSAIKNDFVVWGLRTNSSKDQIPVRYHLAIDKKPQVGKNTYQVFKYVDIYDRVTERWYQPIKYANKSNFPSKGLTGVFYYSQADGKIYQWKQVNNLSQYKEIEGVTLKNITPTDWRTELYFQGISSQPYGVDSNFYYTELLAEWPKIYDIENNKFREEIIKDSSQLDYYLDFINPNTPQMQRICVENIGRRSVVLNENQNVNCVIEPYIPDVILIKKDYSNEGSTNMKILRDECIEKGLSYTQIDEKIYNLLEYGRNLNSAYDEIKQMLYQYINYNENITLQTLPVYFLQPNTCIEVENKDIYIEGNYIINSLSYNLDVSSVLSINASKIVSKDV